MEKQILVVGAGFSGAVVANQLANNTNKKIVVVDSRNHIGGNCHTYQDFKTKITIHKYGPHIFHTNDVSIWKYIQKFGEFNVFTNRVKAVADRGVFSLPINLLTINQYFGKNFSPTEAKQFIIEEGKASGIKTPRNFEEQGIKLLGKELYYSFIDGYTRKQWGCSPKLLSAKILSRLPVRFNYDDNYYNDIYQGIPVNGYTEIIERMLNHSQITIELNSKYTKSWNESFDLVIYTGPVDEYFQYQFGRLGYRTVIFKKKYGTGDFQGNAVINYCNSNVSYTRIHEHKYFTPWNIFNDTVYFYEYSKETEGNDIPYYPKRLEDDMKLLDKYNKLIKNEKNVHFLGRLGTYRYLDMDKVIKEAIHFSHQIINQRS